MATIPIEVIVQDAEVPVVPSEDGANNTETNITVPDTGTISSSGDTSSSASSIILPAILLVLAIGSIVAILIHKYHKQKKDKISKKEKLAVATSSTIAVLAVTVLISNLMLPATKAAASDVTDGIVPAEDKVSITVTRDGSSAEESIESTATITSTSDFGYKVLLSMTEGVGTSNLYLNGDEASEHYIAATESTGLGDNTWGYALTEDGEYSAIPLVDNAVIVAQGDEPVEAEDLSIYYGVMVSSDLPAGTYSGGEIEYNLISLEPTISTLTYMQDFAKLSESGKASVLRSMTEGEQYTLKDSRDDKSYFISKLADGNVWMMQNLNLDLSTGTEFTPANTNISSNWTPTSSTIVIQGTSVPGWQNSNTAPYSADPGPLYIYSSGTTNNDDQYNSLADCQAAHPDCSMHNHAGNYYNWSAAVASNDTSEYGDDDQYAIVGSSICPAGWRLPNVTGNDGNITRSEWGTLLLNESIVNDSIGGGYTTDGFNNIRKSPIWLVRFGDFSNGSLYDVGYGGYYWFSTVGSSTSAFYLFFGSSRLSLAGSTNRSGGYSVRCVAE